MTALTLRVARVLAFSAAVTAGAPLGAQAPAAQPAVSLPAAAEVLKKYRTAIGGELAIKKHTSRVVKGTFEIPAQGMRGELTLLAAAPDRMRLAITLPGLGEMERGYDGAIGWSLDNTIGPRLLDGCELAELKHSADFYDDLHDISKFTSATVVGRTSFEGQSSYELHLTRQSGLEYTEFFDVDSGLLIGLKTNACSQMGTVPVTTIVTEYKPFGGVLTPTITRQKLMGLESVTTISSVTFDSLDPKEFALPPAIAALAAQKK
jgi:zinc protease